MAIFGTQQASSAPAFVPGQRRQNGDRPQAKIWLNVGYDAGGKFVNLPIGIPVDTMEPAKESGQNEDWIKFQRARNDLLKQLIEYGNELQPNQEVAIPLTIKIRKVGDKIEVVDNEYSTDLVSLFAGVQQQPTQAEAAE